MATSTDHTKAIELNPKYAHAYNGRAWTYFKAGKAARGLPDAERALELAADDPEYLSTWGHIFETLGKREEAIVDFRRSISRVAKEAVDREAQQRSREGLKRLGASP